MKSADQVRDEESERTLCTVREGILWFLRWGLENVARLQGGMVERRIERVHEKEKSVLYKSKRDGVVEPVSPAAADIPQDDSALSRGEIAQIESQLSPEQLQLFGEENDHMLRHYEDTLGKVQYVLILACFY